MSLYTKIPRQVQESKPVTKRTTGIEMTAKLEGALIRVRNASKTLDDLRPLAFGERDKAIRLKWQTACLNRLAAIDALLAILRKPDLPVAGKSKRAKTASNQKGASRPKGKVRKSDWNDPGEAANAIWRINNRWLNHE
jgi:hypothetical protein